MKSYKVLRWLVLVNVSALGACGGVSSIGSGDDPGANAGGTKGEGASSGTGSGAKPSGMAGVGAVTGTGASTGSGATTGMGGKDPLPGTGATPGVELCMTEADCPPSAPCELCPDGSASCNKTSCVDGKCLTSMINSCAVKCGVDRDCPVPDVACTDCGDGNKACPTSECRMGFCATSYPGCANVDPCKGLACGAECKSCGPDGACDAMVASYCSAEGKCQPGLPQCGGDKCETAMDCGTAPPNCVACGNDTCAAFDCIANKCVFTCPANPNPECKTSEDCPMIGDSCTMCNGGKCAVQACLQGSCELVCPVQ